MNFTWMAKLRGWLIPSSESGAIGRRPLYEMFALPHDFKPQMSLIDAVVAAIGAFMRIVLGSLLFAIWGGYSLTAWATIRSPLLRDATLLALLGLFLVLMAGVMLAISALVRRFLERGSRT